MATNVAEVSRTTPLIVGLTGGIGTGKSTAAAIFAELGAHVIDVDAVGRGVAEVGGRAHDAVVERFGPTVVADGKLDRAALASIVFSDKAALADLEAISHPAINAVMIDEIATIDPGTIVVLDMAILVESTLGRWGDQPSDGYEHVVVIEAPLETRIARVVEMRGMDPEDARNRVTSQAGDDERRAVADQIILNDRDLATLRTNVETAWTTIGNL